MRVSASLAAWSLAAPVADERSFWLPQAAARTGDRVDSVFYSTCYLSSLLLLLIVASTLYLAIRRRRRGETHRAGPVSGNARLAIVVAVIAAAMLLVVFVRGFSGWIDGNIPPDDAYRIRVTAKKWSWSFDYPECSGVTELVVPVDTPIQLRLSSRDVAHSFHIPAFRLRSSVLPDRHAVTWFEARREGAYDILCGQHCGRQQSQMLSRVQVVSPIAFKKWLADGCGASSLSPRDLGQKLFKVRCAACHSPTAARSGLAGPALGGLYGKLATTDVGQVKVDESYIRESILDPLAKKVVGYNPVMPTFKGLLNDGQINALIDYVRSLGE